MLASAGPQSTARRFAHAHLFVMSFEASAYKSHIFSICLCASERNPCVASAKQQQLAASAPCHLAHHDNIALASRSSNKRTTTKTVAPVCAPVPQTLRRRLWLRQPKEAKQKEPATATRPAVSPTPSSSKRQRAKRGRTFFLRSPSLFPLASPVALPPLLRSLFPRRCARQVSRRRGERVTAETECKHTRQLEGNDVHAHARICMLLFLCLPSVAACRCLSLPPLSSPLFSSLLCPSFHAPRDATSSSARA